jgi:hypothetical protein
MTFGRFWAIEGDQTDEDEGEEAITTPTPEEFIAAAARVGFTKENLIQVENEIESSEKVSFSSPSSSDFRCPLSSKIINAIAREISLKRYGKPWKGSLPKPRISPQKTLGDVVIKNSYIRLHGGQLILRSFKMVLPSMIQGSNSVTQPKKPGDLTKEWPSLPGTRSPEIMHERTAISMLDSVPKVQNSEFKRKTCNPGGTLAGFQNSPMDQKESEPTMTTHQGTRILIHNGKYKAWFCPSKGLNELSTQAGKPTTPGIKARISSNPKCIPQPPSTIHTRRRRTYAEVLMTEKGGESRWGRDAGHAEGGDRERSPINGGMNLGSGNSGAMNPGNNNRARVAANQGHSNQFMYNPGYNRGRSYGGYARG